MWLSFRSRWLDSIATVIEAICLRNRSATRTIFLRECSDELLPPLKMSSPRFSIAQKANHRSFVLMVTASVRQILSEATRSKRLYVGSFTRMHLHSSTTDGPRRARSAWCFWARVLSWTVLGLNFWEVLCIAILGLIGKLSAIEIPEYLASWSFAPTAVFVLAFFSCQAGLLRHHDVIHDNKNQYPDL